MKQAPDTMELMTPRRVLHASIHFFFSFLLMLGGVVQIFGQQYDRDRERELQAERRFTTLEGSVASLVDDMRTIKNRGQWDWIQQVALALLVGERGHDVLRRKRASPPDNLIVE